MSLEDDQSGRPGRVVSSLRRAMEVVRTAPSFSAGGRRLLRAVFARVPFLRPVRVTTRLIKEQKTGFWQAKAGFDYFVSKNEPDPNKNPSAAYLNVVSNEFFLGQCPPEANVLDVGCGHGLVSLFLAKHGRAVTACDISEPMLKELAKSAMGLKIKTQRADAYHLPFADEQFDVVVTRQFLYQFPDWPVVLREMARCCRRGGRLLIHFTSRENADMIDASNGPRCDFGEINSIRQIRPGQEQAFIGAFGQREIEKVCRGIGLTVVQRSPCSFFYYNRLIGHSLGTEGFKEYNRELLERMKDPQVFEFVTWFEKTALREMPVWISFWNILVLEKP